MDNPLLYLDSGSARRKNVGEIVAPTNPLREPPSPPPPPPRPCGCQVPAGGGCRPCGHKVCQIHKHLVTTDTTTVKSFYDDRPIKVKKPVDCCTSNLVYLLQCTLHHKQYTGSSVAFKSRWSKHRSDMAPVYFIDRIGIIAKLMPFFGENIYLLRSHANFRRGGASNGHNYNKQTNVTYFVSVLNFIDINTIHFFIKKCLKVRQALGTREV